MRLAAALVLALLVAACAPAPQPSPETTTPSAPPGATGTTTTPTTPATPPDPPDAPPCLAGDRPFHADGSIGSLQPGDADSAVLASVDWEVREGCERLVLRFATLEGAPAVEPPAVTGSLLRQAGVLRLHLGSDITASALAEQAVETELAERVFVVAALDGTRFVDVHLAAPAFARVAAATSPAQLVVDLRPGGDPVGSPFHRPGELVVVEPGGDTASYPLTVTGYLRTGASELEGVLTSLEDGSQRVALGSVADQTDTWGSFSLVFPEGPSGRVSLSVAGLSTVELRIP